MQTNRAFTLIELLVVVLIIGILATIALPQYRKAVEKSRAVQAQTLVHALYEAQHTFMLANGNAASTFEQLDIDIPWSSANFDEMSITDVRANDDWALMIYNSSMTTSSYVIRLTGKYKGGGFEIPSVDGGTPLLNKPGTLFCVEHISSFEGNAGDYCQKLYHGTLIFTGQFRHYQLP